MRMTRDAYAKMVAEDVAWLRTAPRTPERDHVLQILALAVSYEYGEVAARKAAESRVRDLTQSLAGAEASRDAAEAKLARVESRIREMADDLEHEARLRVIARGANPETARSPAAVALRAALEGSP